MTHSGSQFVTSTDILSYLESQDKTYLLRDAVNGFWWNVDHAYYSEFVQSTVRPKQCKVVGKT